MPGRPTNLDDSRARAYCACSRCGLGVVWTFLQIGIQRIFSATMFGIPDESFSA